MCKAFLFKHLYHARNIFLCICLTFPQIKLHIQTLIILL